MHKNLNEIIQMLSLAAELTPSAANAFYKLAGNNYIGDNEF